MQNGTAAIEYTYPVLQLQVKDGGVHSLLKIAVAHADADVDTSADGNVISGVEVGDTAVAIANQEKFMKLQQRICWDSCRVVD